MFYTLCHLVTRMSCCPVILCMLSYLPYLASGLPSHGYLLDTYYWTCNMPGSFRPCTWAMATGRTPGHGCLKHPFHRGPWMWSMSPQPSVHILECLPMVIDWKPNTELIPCQVHPVPAHKPCPPFSRKKAQGNTRCYKIAVLLKLEFWSGEKNLTKGWIIHSYEYSFFYSSSQVLWFPSHYAETVHTSGMACDTGMFINRERSFKVFLKPFSKSSCRSTNILFITLYPLTCIPIYHSTFLCDCVFILTGSPEGSWLNCPLSSVLLNHVYCKHS